MDSDLLPPSQHDVVIPSLKTFSIPKAKKKDLLTKISLDSRDGYDIIQYTQKSLWDPESMTINYKTIHTVHNPKLASQYALKRTEMREKKYKEVDTVDSYAFLFFKKIEECMEICRHGISTKHQNHLPSSFSEIGDQKYGVYLSRCADAVTRHNQLFEYKNESILLVFKIIKGRLKQMSPVTRTPSNSSQEGIEPSPGYDGHVSKEFQLGKKKTQDKMYDASLLYLYEVDADNYDVDDDDAIYAKTPRQILPYAIIELEAKQKGLPLSIPQPRAAVQGAARRENIIANQSASHQNMQQPNKVFVYEDYRRLACENWEGSYFNGSQFFTEISLQIFSPSILKLPLKGPNLCISQKISLKNLQKVFPSKIFRKLPCVSLKPTASVDGLTFLHAEIHPIRPFLKNKQITKLHYHFLKNDIAGFCSFPFGCKLYIIPTCEFTDQLGITNPDYPQILHCIFMNAYDSTIQPEKNELFRSEACKRFIDCQRNAFLDHWHENEELKTFRVPAEVHTGRPFGFTTAERRTILNCFISIRNALLKTNANNQNLHLQQESALLNHTLLSQLPRQDDTLPSPTLHFTASNGEDLEQNVDALLRTNSSDFSNHENKIIGNTHQTSELVKKTSVDSYVVASCSSDTDVTDSERLVIMSDSQEIDNSSQNRSRDKTTQKQVVIVAKDVENQEDKLHLVHLPIHASTDKEIEKVGNDDERVSFQDQSDVDFQSDALVIDTAMHDSSSQEDCHVLSKKLNHKSDMKPDVFMDTTSTKNCTHENQLLPLTSCLSVLKDAMREKVESTTPSLINDALFVQDNSSSGSDLDHINTKIQKTRKSQFILFHPNTQYLCLKHRIEKKLESRSTDTQSFQTPQKSLQQLSSSYRSRSRERKSHLSRSNHRYDNYRSRYERRNSYSRSRSRSPIRRPIQSSRERSASKSRSESPFFHPDVSSQSLEKGIQKTQSDLLTTHEERPNTRVTSIIEFSCENRPKETSQVQVTTTATNTAVMTTRISRLRSDHGSKNIGCDPFSDISVEFPDVSDVETWSERARKKINAKNEKQKQKIRKTRREREKSRRNKNIESFKDHREIESKRPQLICSHKKDGQNKENRDVFFEVDCHSKKRKKSNGHMETAEAMRKNISVTTVNDKGRTFEARSKISRLQSSRSEIELEEDLLKKIYSHRQSLDVEQSVACSSSCPIIDQQENILSLPEIVIDSPLLDTTTAEVLKKGEKKKDLNFESTHKNGELHDTSPNDSYPSNTNIAKASPIIVTKVSINGEMFATSTNLVSFCTTDSEVPDLLSKSNEKDFSFDYKRPVENKQCESNITRPVDMIVSPVRSSCTVIMPRLVAGAPPRPLTSANEFVLRKKMPLLSMPLEYLSMTSSALSPNPAFKVVTSLSQSHKFVHPCQPCSVELVVHSHEKNTCSNYQNVGNDLLPDDVDSVFHWHSRLKHDELDVFCEDIIKHIFDRTM